MHILSSQQVNLQDTPLPIDLQQTPGDIVFLSAADTDLMVAAKALLQIPQPFFKVRLASVMQLSHPYSIDLYIDTVIRHAKIVVVRLLGGRRYWPYGVDQICQIAKENRIKVIWVAGDDRWDDELQQLSTETSSFTEQIWQYFVQGGIENIVHMFQSLGGLIGKPVMPTPPKSLLRAGIYWPQKQIIGLHDIQNEWLDSVIGTTAIVFYRALLQSGDLEVIDRIIQHLQRHSLNPLPIFVSSLKEKTVGQMVGAILAQAKPSVILNATGFAIGHTENEAADPLRLANCPILQLFLSSSDQTFWQQQKNGLLARDMVMQVILPEMDGRILSRLISFKGKGNIDPLTEHILVRHQPVDDRIDFACKQAYNWAFLQKISPSKRHVSLILSNYPNRDGRLANGVGLDTPASAVQLMAALRQAGYDLPNHPQNGEDLVNCLQSGPTNANPHRPGGVRWAEEGYRAFFEALPKSLQDAVTKSWGSYQQDPFFQAGHFRLAIHQFGNLTIGIQPMRRLINPSSSIEQDDQANYHDPFLPPPHHYLAFYGWLRQVFKVHAFIHIGKHGNLEWLPGKAIGLSSDCFPEVIMGPIPNLYPFIVNNPGEGSQAKRRTSAVIIDHLTPPLARAENYGDLLEIEKLLDEYYQAASFDQRRAKILHEQILSHASLLGVMADENIGGGDHTMKILSSLDRYVCDVKERQIRQGLHIMGIALTQEKIADFLLAMGRLPRDNGQGGNASLLRALAADLGLLDHHFDPLQAKFEEVWNGKRPAILQSMLDSPWRNTGDTVERLEILAAKLLSKLEMLPAKWVQTQAVIKQLEEVLLPKLQASPHLEITNLLKGLNGEFVAPGPSGAPTRGRWDVLPTGRNFYSVDTRQVPTAAAWQLGWKSATLLLERHRQDYGDWPRTVALSAWGTANMRTAGEDIAQMLAMMGVKPVWEMVSGRVTGIEIIPLSVLDRPRIDVCLRISGFFRDAFPAQIDLLNQAVQAVSNLDEAADDNPLAAQIKQDKIRLKSEGVGDQQADLMAGARIFGAAPGSYGTGLQAFIDDGVWQNRQQLAAAFIDWGSHIYSGHHQTEYSPQMFRQRLHKTQAIIHNQDNREHDILDSDDYYQFEGGWSLAVEEVQGQSVPIWHNDHSNPANPQILSLQQEIGRVIQSRAANPKWLKTIMQHGYKGAFEIAATVDYLVAFAITTNCVQDHHFDRLYKAYLEDQEVIDFLSKNNPSALKEIAEKFLEAQNRELWHPRSNQARDHLLKFAKGRA